MQSEENSLPEGWIIDASNSIDSTMCYVHMPTIIAQNPLAGGF
jgi:hypothetical protein